MKHFLITKKTALHLLLALGLFSTTTTFVGCKEDVDESNFAIKSEETAADYVDHHDNLSMIKEIFLRVRLGNSEGASSIYSVLSARGNYTMFLPTNEAVQAFLSENGVPSVAEMSNELAELIAKSCIIDHSNGNAYETADFPTNGAFGLPNLNDRLLSCTLNEESDYIINGTSKVIDEDEEVSNGFIHIVERVVAPSALTLDKLIEKADNMKVFSFLLQKTGWADQLHDNLDLSYENPERPLIYNLNNVAPFTYAQHRYIGYTAFVEPDSVYAAALGFVPEVDAEGQLTNGDDLLTKLEAQAAIHYGSAAAGDYTNEDNAVNQFVAYHLINGKMAFNKLNHHYNEYNYKFGQWQTPQHTNMPTNVWDFYTTMGKHRGLLKVTQVGDAGFEQDLEHKVYVNRMSKYADGPEDDYREIGIIKGFKGNLVHAQNGENDNNGLNGYYYPIEKMLFYDKAFRQEMMKKRVRMDMTTLLPELLSNNIRGTIYTRFENGFFDNITQESSDTKLLYLMPQGASGWFNYQGDEFMVSGLYDFVLKLPPVPYDGTYEVRMGVAHNSLRGMCQIYFGEDPNRLTPAGLPYDMRQYPEPTNPAIPWHDDTDDWVVNREVDKNLRNQGYMKAPNYYTRATGNADVPVRSCGGANGAVRRIITVANMEAGKNYYLRFKTALKKTDSQFYMDYVEYASTTVYNGPTVEDIW